MATEGEGPKQRSGATRRGRSKAKLLEAARTLFEERGWNGTTLNDVAELAGVSIATIYNHYPTKTALWDSVIVSLFDDLVDTVHACIGSSHDPDALVALYIKLVVKITRQYRGMWGGGLPFTEGTTLIGFARVIEALTDVLEDGCSRGQFAVRRPIPEVAHFYVAVIIGYAITSPQTSADAIAEVMLSQLRTLESGPGT